MIKTVLENVVTEQTQVLFIIFITILAFEMLSGVLKAIKNKELDSTKFREGLLSKSGYFLQVGLCLVVSIMIEMPYLLYADLIWVSCSESVSVLENLSMCGVKIPTFIKNILEKTKEVTEENTNNK